MDYAALWMDCTSLAQDYAVGAQRSQFHRDYMRVHLLKGDMTLLVKCKQKALMVDEIMITENTSTEAMPGHYVTRSERQSL